MNVRSKALSSFQLNRSRFVGGRLIAVVSNGIGNVEGWIYLQRCLARGTRISLLRVYRIPDLSRCRDKVGSRAVRPQFVHSQVIRRRTAGWNDSTEALAIVFAIESYCGAPNRVAVLIEYLAHDIRL